MSVWCNLLRRNLIVVGHLGASRSILEDPGPQNIDLYYFILVMRGSGEGGDESVFVVLGESGVGETPGQL